MKRLLFFINPNAGHAEIRGTLMEVLEIFSAGGYEVTVHMTTGPRDLTRQIAARGAQYDLIVCTGGDGTLNEAVSGLMALPYEKRPKLGYIPGGTVNDVASTLGLSKDTVRAAQEIMDGHPFPLDIGSFGPDRFFTYVAAFGIFTDVPYETPQEDKRIWGRLAYIMNGAGALGRLKPTHVRVYYDDHQEEADVLVGLVTSTTSVGGFKTTRDLGISLNDGLYEMILVRATKNLAEFNLAMLLTLIRNTWYWNNAKDVIATALEYPPAWIAIVYAAMTEKTYKNSPVYKLIEIQAKRSRNVEEFRLNYEGFLRRVMALETIDQPLVFKDFDDV